MPRSSLHSYLAALKNDLILIASSITIFFVIEFFIWYFFFIRQPQLLSGTNTNNQFLFTTLILSRKKKKTEHGQLLELLLSFPVFSMQIWICSLKENMELTTFTVNISFHPGELLSVSVTCLTLLICKV